MVFVRSRGWQVGGLVIAVCLMASCSGPPDGTPTTNDTAEAPIDSVEIPDETEATPDATVTTLNDTLETSSDTFESPNGTFETLNDVLELPPEPQHQGTWEAIEESKRECMNESGFDYGPHVQPRFAVGGSAISARSALISEETRDWVEENGYGLTARLIELTTFNDSDPNLTIRRALDPGESETYDAAFDQCAIQAQTEVGFDDHYVEMATELSQLVAELEAEIVSDPRLEDATQRWAECMDRRGHSYQRLSDPRDEVAERLHEAQEERVEEIEASYADLLREEKALAIADLDCRLEAGVDQILSTVMKEADADFVDRHRALLEEYYSIRHGS